MNRDRNSAGTESSPAEPKTGARKRGSAFRSVSPIVRTAKLNRGRSPAGAAASKKVSIGSHLTLTVGTIAVIVALFVLLVGPPLFNLVSQIETRNKVHGQLVEAQEENAELRQKLRLWQDPNFISQQARERLGYVKPGETRYAVVDPGESYRERQEAKMQSMPQRPWYLIVADSSRMAGQSEQAGKNAAPGARVNPVPSPGAEEVTPTEEKKK